MSQTKEERMAALRAEMTERAERYGSMDEASRARALEDARDGLIDSAAKEFASMELPRRDLQAVMDLLWDRVGDDLDFAVIERSPERLAIKVTRCMWADEMRSRGAPEVGLAFHCAWDYGFVAGLNPKIRFSRTRTLMGGDSCCDHSYDLEAD